MSAWKIPQEREKKHEAPPPKPHKPPHEATYEGLAHVSEQIEDLRKQLDRIEARLNRQ